MTNNKTNEEWIEEFNQYQSKGYSGGESGLRCDKCDGRYSGEPSIKQFCPRCMAKEALEAKDQQHLEAMKSWKQAQLEKLNENPLTKN